MKHLKSKGRSVFDKEDKARHDLSLSAEGKLFIMCLPIPVFIDLDEILKEIYPAKDGN